MLRLSKCSKNWHNLDFSKGITLFLWKREALPPLWIIPEYWAGWSISQQRYSAWHFCWCCFYTQEAWRHSRASCPTAKALNGNSHWEGGISKGSSFLLKPPSRGENFLMLKKLILTRLLPGREGHYPQSTERTWHGEDHIIYLIWPSVGQDPEPTSGAKLPGVILWK